MSAADDRQISTEAGATEMLLSAMVRRPVAEYVEDIRKLTEEDINAKNSTGRTILHQAVILGKADWARELLEVGANQMVKDGDGKTALELAKEMLSKHAGEKERKDLLEYMLDRPSVGSRIGSCGSSGDEGASIGTRKFILNLEESLKSAFSNISTQLNAMKESLEGMKVELNAVKNSQEGLKGEVNSVKNSLEEMKGGLNAVKNSQEEMKDGLDAVKKSLEGVKCEATTTVETKESEIIRMIISLDKEALRDTCMEDMMGKTKVIPSNEKNKSKMRKLYEKMYDEDSISSTILQFIRLKSVEVHVDFESYNIEGMKPTLRNHDGKENSGAAFNVFADFEERKAYVGGKHSDEFIISLLANALSQLCVLLAFGNKGLPYSEDGERDRELYQGILREAERKNRDGEELHAWIRYGALDRTANMGKEIQLHATVPAIIARYGLSEGRSILKRQLPSLLEYFEDHVMTALRGEKQW